MDQSRRLELHELLKTILGSGNVYFQPPESFKMAYPCIVYENGTFRAWRANNDIYKMLRPYKITVIYRDPDSDLPQRLASLPYCSHDRNFTTSNLYHDVFTLYY